MMEKQMEKQMWGKENRNYYIIPGESQGDYTARVDKSRCVGMGGEAWNKLPADGKRKYV